MARRVNTSMMQLYWNIGAHFSKGIEKGYPGVVKRLSADLQQNFLKPRFFSTQHGMRIVL